MVIRRWGCFGVQKVRIRGFNSTQHQALYTAVTHPVFPHLVIPFKHKHFSWNINKTKRNICCVHFFSHLINLA